MIKSLVIDGTPESSHGRCRFLIWINGEKVWLQCRMFGYLSKLAVARRLGSGWLHKTEIEPGTNYGRYIYRLKDQIKIQTELVLNIPNDRRGNYYLDVEPDRIFFNHKQLSDFPDALVREAVGMVVSKQERK